MEVAADEDPFVLYSSANVLATWRTMREVPARTLISNALDEELGAIAAVEELGSLDNNGIKLSKSSLRKKRSRAGDCCEALHIELVLGHTSRTTRRRSLVLRSGSDRQSVVCFVLQTDEKRGKLRIMPVRWRV